MHACRARIYRVQMMPLRGTKVDDHGHEVRIRTYIGGNIINSST